MSIVRPQKITVAHSPDADDAFMFYALARGKVDTEGFEFHHTLQDIQKCNVDALRRKFDVTAFSFASYPKIADHYKIMTCGASMGEKDYGPLIVAKTPLTLSALAQKKIAIPGEMTTAALALKLVLPEAKHFRIFPFNRILDAVCSGEADAGLLIHEGQLVFQKKGLFEILNLGRWWWEQEKLPLPLGGNGIAKDLDPVVQIKVDRLLKKSIQYALQHRAEALDYALQFAGDLNPKLTDRFVGMYVNERTLDYGKEGRRAVEKLLQRGMECGLLPHVEPEFLVHSPLSVVHSPL